MKLYKGIDGLIRTYRKDYKCKSLNHGANELTLPNFDCEVLNQCLCKFAHHYACQLPEPETNGSIYLRINMFEDINTLALFPLGEATLSVIGSVVGPYYYGTRKSIKVRVETKRMKNFDGSLAYVKSSSNFAAAHVPEMVSLKMRYDTTLWLYNNLYITELTSGKFSWL
ncbi:Aminotransferase class IV-like protein [Dinothrombium tinctorium]|nr:Aminotransferase class IV-like protein [Dinothrombium tinctorium]RWS00799.1 Aminotransferase class IV-like protein [Dinothrombium tinctorium]